MLPHPAMDPPLHANDSDIILVAVPNTSGKTQREIT